MWFVALMAFSILHVNGRIGLCDGSSKHMAEQGCQEAANGKRNRISKSVVVKQCDTKQFAKETSFVARSILTSLDTYH